MHVVFDESIFNEEIKSSSILQSISRNFTTNVPNFEFVAKFASSLRSSKVHNKIHKLACKLHTYDCFFYFRDQSGTLFTNWLVNSNIDLRTSQRSSEHFRSKFREIDCKRRQHKTCS